MRYWNCHYCGTSLFEGIKHRCTGVRRAEHNITIADVVDLVSEISLALVNFSKGNLDRKAIDQSRAIWQKAVDLKERIAKAAA